MDVLSCLVLSCLVFLSWLSFLLLMWMTGCVLSTSEGCERGVCVILCGLVVRVLKKYKRIPRAILVLLVMRLRRYISIARVREHSAGFDRASSKMRINVTFRKKNVVRNCIIGHLASRRIKMI